jgi:polyketide synthase PksM/rhizoxin synthesis polyketide synthase/nonribosomal peptide synthetase RhiB
MIQHSPSSHPDRAIAVIGMACRLPGAPDLDAYRRLLLDGRLGIVTSDAAALRANGIPEELLAHPRLVRRFGVLAGVDAFDAAAFGIPPARAAVLDPQQRILLELAVGAMEHAGYAGEAGVGSVGVYVSLAHCSYRGGMAADAASGFFSLTASDKDYGATRVSYALDLTGPSVTVQSACSGSLAALHMAVEALLSGQCDLALAGGASIILPQGAYLAAPGLMLSADGQCRPFDAAAAGTVPGNGAGLVVLKRLDRACADGDTIHAVVLGSAIANDGSRKVDYLAPGIRGQMRAVGEAWSVAGVEPASLGLIEAHGTGTALGDPIEITALSRLFRHLAEQGLPPPETCRLGSVKANIGHLNVASGIAGFIKAVLAVRDGVIPGVPGFHSPNPEAPFDDTPLLISAEPASWPGLRRAGVSSFGFGGTNVHVVLEQPPQAKASHRASGGPLLLPLSAHDAAALERMRRDLTKHLRGSAPGDFPDIAYTLQRGRADRPVRAMLQAHDLAEALAQLDAPGPLPVIGPDGPSLAGWGNFGLGTNAGGRRRGPDPLA